MNGTSRTHMPRSNTFVRRTQNMTIMYGNMWKSPFNIIAIMISALFLWGLRDPVTAGVILGLIFAKIVTASLYYHRRPYIIISKSSIWIRPLQKRIKKGDAFFSVWPAGNIAPWLSPSVGFFSGPVWRSSFPLYRVAYWPKTINQEAKRLGWNIPIIQ